MNEDPTLAAATTPTLPVASVPRRVAAGLIDVAIVSAAFLIMAAVYGSTQTTTGPNGSEASVTLSGPGATLFVVLAFLYHFLTEGTLAKTPGKLLLHLRVQAVEGELTPGKVFLRNLLRLIDVIPVFYMLGFVLVLTSPRRQRLGDRIAGTIVVNSRSVDSP